jgi:hypothetical protein
LVEESRLGTLEGIVIMFKDLHAFPGCGADTFTSGRVYVRSGCVHCLVGGKRCAELDVVATCGNNVPVRVSVKGVNVDAAANGAHDVQAQGSGSVPVALPLGVREVEVFAGGSWGRPGSGGGIFFGESVELLRPSDFLEVRGSDANCVPLDYGVGGVEFVWVGVPKPM